MFLANLKIDIATWQAVLQRTVILVPLEPSFSFTIAVREVKLNIIDTGNGAYNTYVFEQDVRVTRLECFKARKVFI